MTETWTSDIQLPATSLINRVKACVKMSTKRNILNAVFIIIHATVTDVIKMLREATVQN